ncbi:aldose 1-epimerase family protein [Taibaiella soli]|uniref:Aldose 1-epimerase family protein n=1 Tax=Taibaiella soli TaxID=1649169 RepID=A0A2W2C2D1_9BACT|nr:aldose 1-epimerase family protein [Taibaiella soli]PZF74243.1 aldose 1-epimerase family protein [Taibaiella soli]
MDIVLENEKLKVKIHPRGAELQSIYHKEYKQEYMWNGDPTHWAKFSPILFPVVGQLKDNTYYYKDKAYSLSRHGFAREMMFETSLVTETSVRFSLKSNEETRRNYPFDFELCIHYKIEGDQLYTGYEVINTGTEIMYFSIGGHPAFAVPLEKGRDYGEYKIEFSEEETAPRWLINDGLISVSAPFLDHQKSFKLSNELFAKDAIVLKHLSSKTVSLCSDSGHRGLTIRIEGFPFLGIWAAPNAPFVCIEPWCGIADSQFHNQQLTEKEGIISLDAGASWLHEWELLLF